MSDGFDTALGAKTFKARYSMGGVESWADTCKRVVKAVCGQHLTAEQQEDIYQVMLARKFIPGGRYLYSAGRDHHQINNCFLFRAYDTREAWAELMHNSTAALTTGGGIGVDYSLVRAKGIPLVRTGGFASGPISLMNMVNEAGRYIRMGGSRRSAIWAGLNWAHADVFEFMRCKDYSPDMQALKAKDWEFPVSMEGTNISVIYDTEFFVAYDDRQHPKHKLARRVWQENCYQAFKTAEPGMSFNFLKDSESLRNACCEVTSSDDSDKCNLGTLWLNRHASKEDLAKTVWAANALLLCGGLYSDVPYAKVREVGSANNRIGLGLGGIAEWLLLRRLPYQVNPELHKWLNVYEQESEASAYVLAKQLGVAVPRGKRAIAPTGTIGILAETTTGIEPLFCKAYKRRAYLEAGGEQATTEYVVDGTIKRMLASGMSVAEIKEVAYDAYDISFKDRVKFQADVQNYVDMAISSTCNMPPWGSELNSESTVVDHAKVLYKYARRLRGFTCYPDGSRSGQPLVRCDLEEALANEGKLVYEQREDDCSTGVCGL